MNGIVSESASRSISGVSQWVSLGGVLSCLMGGFVFGYHTDPVSLAEIESDWAEATSWIHTITGKLSSPSLNSQGMRGPVLANQTRAAGIEAPQETLTWSRSSTEVDPEATVTLAKGLNEQQRHQLQQILIRAGVAPRAVRSARAPVRPDPKVWDPVESTSDEMALASEPGTDPCKLGLNHEFLHAGRAHCPERATALSRNHRAEGWVKVEGSGHLPSIVHQPAPNGGASLLLDSSELNDLALRAGIGIVKGAGVIVGPAQTGYRISFAGRSEEPEWFESGGKRYFAILNAEPGAGVIELAKENDPTEIATVFVPVLGDLITYVDLAPPVRTDLSVRVVKTGRLEDPDTTGLTVGWSMHQGIRAITRNSGFAELKGVHIVPGFPAFLDIQSRRGEEPGFVHRYEIRNPADGQLHLLPQIPEPQLSKWLGQVRTGLSDQSAMIVGSIRPSRINPQGPPVTASVEPLTEKYGLEPLTYTLLWDGKISSQAPLDPRSPRFMVVQIPEGLSQVRIGTDQTTPAILGLLPVSPRVIHVITE